MLDVHVEPKPVDNASICMYVENQLYCICCA
jgi:hypothetical protein